MLIIERNKYDRIYQVDSESRQLRLLVVVQETLRGTSTSTVPCYEGITRPNLCTLPKSPTAQLAFDRHEVTASLH